jgi:hypothetical protein
MIEWPFWQFAQKAKEKPRNVFAQESLQSPDSEPRNLLVLSLPSFRTRPAKQENDGRLASLASLPWWVRSGAPFWTLGLYR